jgi:mRNA interferase MazF
VRQYELWWAQLPSPIGRRPVLLLTRTSAYAYLNKVIVAEVTGTIRNIPQEIAVGPQDGLPRRSVVNMDNVHVVPVRQLDERIGRLDAVREADVKRAMGYALDWPELKVL